MVFRTQIWSVMTIGMGLGNLSVLQQVISIQNYRHGTKRSRSQESASYEDAMTISTKLLLIQSTFLGLDFENVK